MNRTLVILAAVAAVVIVTVLAAVRMRAPVDAPNPAAAPLSAPPASRETLAELAASLPVQYEAVGQLGDAPLFTRRLADVAVGPGDHVLVAGDLSILVFDHCYAPQPTIPLPAPPECLAVDEQWNVYVGMGARVVKLDRDGAELAVIGAEVLGSAPTSLAVRDGVLYVAEVPPATDLRPAGRVHRFTLTGDYLGEIGPADEPLRFRTPNERLNLAADPLSAVAVCNPGGHHVALIDADGALLARLGRYDTEDPAGFVGCCNPINVAVTETGRVVVGEKIASRIKLYDRDGALLAIVPAWDLSEDAVSFPLAVGAGERIFVADTIAKRVRVFSPAP